jgi:hypothetical protein
LFQQQPAGRWARCVYCLRVFWVAAGCILILQAVRPPARFLTLRQYGRKQGNIISYHTNRTAMSTINKTFALLLTFVIAMSCLTLLTVKPVGAQSTPALQVPQFTVSFVEQPTTADPYTGTNVTHGSIEVIINNQPLNGLYLNIRYKGHFQNDSWTYPYNYQSQYKYDPNGGGVDVPTAPTVLSASVGNYTTVTFPADSYASNSQIDFQIQALLYSPEPTLQLLPHAVAPSYLPALVLNATSDWSNIQTVTIPAGSASTSPNPTDSSTSIQTVTETPNNSLSSNQQFIDLVIAVVVVTLAVAVASLLMYVRKIKNASQLSKR